MCDPAILEDARPTSALLFSRTQIENLSGILGRVDFIGASISFYEKKDLAMELVLIKEWDPKGGTNALKGEPRQMVYDLATGRRVE